MGEVVTGTSSLAAGITSSSAATVCVPEQVGLRRLLGARQTAPVTSFNTKR